MLVGGLILKQLHVVGKTVRRLGLPASVVRSSATFWMGTS